MLEVGAFTAEAIYVLEKKCKLHASCSYEHNTQLGKELGVKYGCPMEDVITGLTIKTFKYFYPTTAPCTFPDRIKQHPLDKHFDLQNVKRIVLEADGYQPYLISPEKGLFFDKRCIRDGKGGIKSLCRRGFFMELEDVLGDHRVWMASCVGIDPCTIVMDFEGTHRKSEESTYNVNEKFVQQKLSIRVYGENNVVNFI
ncbi:dynamin-like protein 6, partial [Tanacetum coccineum]